MIWTVEFWQGAAERMLKTFFQVIAALIGLDAGGVGTRIGLGDLDWIGMISIASVAALLSLATSLGNAEFTAGNGKRYA